LSRLDELQIEKEIWNNDPKFDEFNEKEKR
jgi:hypothetical protein